MEQEKFDEIVQMFEAKTDKNNEHLNMHYLLIKQKDKHFLHSFNGKTGPSDIRSISKTIMTITLGIVMRYSEAGKYPEIDEETYVYPIIKHVAKLENIDNLEKLEKIQVKHLLTHTMGYEDILLMRQDIEGMDPHTYVDHLINYPLVYEPGEYFLYSNTGFYLLSVFLQEFIQEDLLDFIAKELFEPLGIQEYSWERYGNYIAGATRLWLLPEDLLKVGELLYNDGVVNGEALLSKQWIDKMLVPRYFTKSVDAPGAQERRYDYVDTPDRIFRRYAYGYGIWLAKEPIYFGHGTDGQMLIVVPEKEAIIVTLAHHHDLKPIEDIIDYVITDVI